MHYTKRCKFFVCSLQKFYTFYFKIAAYVGHGGPGYLGDLKIHLARSHVSPEHPHSSHTDVQ